MKLETGDASKSQLNQSILNRHILKRGSENQLEDDNYLNPFLWFSPDRTIWKSRHYQYDCVRAAHLQSIPGTEELLAFE